MEQHGEIKRVVRDHYAKVARQSATGDGCGCGCSCGASCCSGDASASPTSAGYDPAELATLGPKQLPSWGCGNPTTLADLRPGQVVLDLGSGGGLDVLLSARPVAPHGKAYGLDMTDEMLALARRHQQEAGITNAEFLKGDISQIPLPADHVDVIISNCVINLAADKGAVLREAWRVLKPGGRLAISDIVFVGNKETVPTAVLQSLSTDCPRRC